MHLKLWAVAIQAMLKEALNIEATIRQVQISVWFDEAQAGNFDITISAIVSTLLDPADYFNSWYVKDGPQNYSKWHNETFEALVRQMNHELDHGQTQDDDSAGRGHHGARSATAPNRLGEDE